jgi:hypothetical protein
MIACLTSGNNAVEPAKVRLVVPPAAIAPGDAAAPIAGEAALEDDAPPPPPHPVTAATSENVRRTRKKVRVISMIPFVLTGHSCVLRATTTRLENSCQH